MAAFALTIFAGAFLLFQVQPLIGKYILPWFGGGPGVWTACVLFFQVALLGGYAYAHLLSHWLKPRTQVMVHLALLGAAMAFLPMVPSDAWKPSGEANPLPRILGLLAATIGLPYFLLSATSPLMQEWFRRLHPATPPYRLYALSNTGSLLALLSYPVYIETQFTRKTQAGLWAGGWVVFALGCALCGLRLWRNAKTMDFPGGASSAEPASDERSQPSATSRLLWVLLPACASVLLLAITNKICQDVAVIPFLWVLPLALYLLSFIICFDSPRWYRRFPFALGLIAALFGLCWALFNAESASIRHQIAFYCGGLFACCMVCHGELYRLRPTAGRLTGYYLGIATGGALGGLFVAVAAPLLFTGYYELQFGMLFCGWLFLTVCARAEGPTAPTTVDGTQTDCVSREPSPPPAGEPANWRARVWGQILRISCWRWMGCTLPILGFVGLDWLLGQWHQRLPQVPRGYFLGVRLALWFLLVAAVAWRVSQRKAQVFRYWRQISCAWLALGWVVLGLVLWTRGPSSDGDVIYARRSFYGVLTIFEHLRNDPEERYLLLQHGRITHGLQFTQPPRDQWATSYYGEGTGIALAMNALPAGHRRIGVVGLGTGTLTALGRAGDYFRIYEINPQVRELAWCRFTYLSNATAKAKAQVELAMGDARLSMEREPPQQFDLLALDAFSSDSIPVHLLTREAFELYQKHLQTNGVIAIHISNHYLDLEPVVINAAQQLNYRVSLVDYEENEEDWWLYSSTWMVLTKNQEILKAPGILEGLSAVTAAPPKIPPWTDDFASLFQILK